MAFVATGCSGDAVLCGRVGRGKGEDVVVTMLRGSVVVVDEGSLEGSSDAVKLASSCDALESETEIVPEAEERALCVLCG